MSRPGISRSLQFVRDIGEGPHDSGSCFIEGGSPRLALPQVVRDLGIAAEVVDVLQFAFGRLHEGSHSIAISFESVIQALSAATT